MTILKFLGDIKEAVSGIFLLLINDSLNDNCLDCFNNAMKKLQIAVLCHFST